MCLLVLIVNFVSVWRFLLVSGIGVCSMMVLGLVMVFMLFLWVSCVIYGIEKL